MSSGGWYRRTQMRPTKSNPEFSKMSKSIRTSQHVKVSRENKGKTSSSSIYLHQPLKMASLLFILCIEKRTQWRRKTAFSDIHESNKNIFKTYSEKKSGWIKKSFFHVFCSCLARFSPDIWFSPMRNVTIVEIWSFIPLYYSQLYYFRSLMGSFLL